MEPAWVPKRKEGDPATGARPLQRAKGNPPTPGSAGASAPQGAAAPPAPPGNGRGDEQEKAAEGSKQRTWGLSRHGVQQEATEH
eukprot:7773824-Pyramimonas_sp.AAC.1